MSIVFLKKYFVLLYVDFLLDLQLNVVYNGFEVIEMNNLKHIRELANYTQSYVADCLGITQQAYANYERGVRQPDNTMLKKLADLFGVSVDYILGRTEDPNYIDPDDELNEYLEYLRTRPELKMLFSLTKDATKADVEKAVKIIETMLGVD